MAEPFLRRASAVNPSGTAFSPAEARIASGAGRLKSSTGKPPDSQKKYSELSRNSFIRNFRRTSTTPLSYTLFSTYTENIDKISQVIAWILPEFLDIGRLSEL
jgi:hypothetical protein